jgi:GntR family transcriptional regulator
MEIVLDLNKDVPLFAQVIEQIKEAVSSNELAPGDALPSIRQLATDLEIDNKTVVKAYRLLERDGVVESRGYRGTFVHPDAKKHRGVDLNALAIKKLDSSITALKRAGLTDSEIRNAFGAVMNGNGERGSGNGDR